MKYRFESYEEDNIKLYLLPKFNSASFGISAHALYYLILKHKIDILLSQDPIVGGFAGVNASKLFKIPIMVEIHADTYFKFFTSRNPYEKILGQIALYSLKNATLVRIVSETFRPELHKVGIPDENIVLIPYRVNLALFDYQREAVDVSKLGIDEDAFVITSIGRFVEQKGYEYLIRGFPQVLNEYPNSYLLIVGRGTLESEYKNLIREIKSKIQTSQIKAHIKVNEELLKLYWEIGKIITIKQKKSSWGDGIIKQISKDLQFEFPNMKGFSVRNIKYMKQWFQFYSNRQQVVAQLDNSNKSQINKDKENSTRQQAVAQLEESQKLQLVKQLNKNIFNIPWGHNIAIITKCKSFQETAFYIQQTIQNNYSRSQLIERIKKDDYQRTGKAISNFKEKLPDIHSKLAIETLKNPYNLDFLSLREEHDERELEDALMDNLSNFLIELGRGFAFVGRQYKLKVGRKDFKIDLLFYHIKLRSYVVIELKTVDFKPEFAGKLNFYVSAIDGEIKEDNDNPTIGLLICKSKDDTVVEYSFKDIKKPIGISEYQLTKILPDQYKSSLPTIEEIEAELSFEIIE